MAGKLFWLYFPFGYYMKVDGGHAHCSRGKSLTLIVTALEIQE